MSNFDFLDVDYRPGFKKYFFYMTQVLNAVLINKLFKDPCKNANESQLVSKFGKNVQSG